MSQSLRYTTSIGHHAGVRRAINTQWDQVFQFGGAISPFERWPDNNYAPHPLPVTQLETPEALVVTAELPGFEAQDVHVDVRQDRLIILAARASEGSENEYYNEILLPDGLWTHRAVMEFSEGLLTLSFPKVNPGVGNWLRMAGQTLQRWLLRGGVFGRQGGDAQAVS